jgi:hypothetical protein
MQTTRKEWMDWYMGRSPGLSLTEIDAPLRKASEEDFAEWLAGGKDLLDHCVCLQYPRSCRFHNGGKTVTDGPHNVLPGIANVKDVKEWLAGQETKVGAFVLMGDNGKRLAKIDPDGNVELWGDVNEAALRFWIAVCQLGGGTLTHRTDLS